ncbi:unnamed protein product [Ixodes pacificus]
MNNSCNRTNPRHQTQARNKTRNREECEHPYERTTTRRDNSQSITLICIVDVERESPLTRSSPETISRNVRSTRRRRRPCAAATRRRERPKTGAPDTWATHGTPAPGGELG